MIISFCSSFFGSYYYSYDYFLTLLNVSLRFVWQLGGREIGGEGKAS